MLLAHAASLREGVAHFPILHQVHGLDAAKMQRAKGESDGAYWMRWWAGRENETPQETAERPQDQDREHRGAFLEGIVNTDCHVLNGWIVRMEAKGGADARKNTVTTCF